MMKALSITFLFISTFILASAGSNKKEVIQYDKTFEVTARGDAVKGTVHLQLVFDQATSTHKEILKFNMVERGGESMRVHRVIYYKNGIFDKPVSAEVKVHMGGKLAGESKITFQEKTYAIEATAYYKRQQQLDKPKVISKKGLPLPKGDMHFILSMSTIGIKIAKKGSHQVTLVMFPGNPTNPERSIEFKENALLEKIVNDVDKTKSFFLTKEGSTKKMVTLKLNKKNEITTYMMQDATLKEIKNK